MKRLTFFLVFIVVNCLSYALEANMKTYVKIAYPVNFDNTQNNYWSLNPVFEIDFDFPLNNKVELCSSINYFNGSFKEMITDIKSFGNYMFISILAGASYNFLRANNWSFIMNLECGYSYAELRVTESVFPYKKSIFCVQSNLEAERKLLDYLFICMNLGIGYYEIYYPVYLGFGCRLLLN